MLLEGCAADEAAFARQHSIRLFFLTLIFECVFVLMRVHRCSILGRGSFGVVVSGIWRCCPVAIKILEIANARPVSEQAVQTFLAEARLQQKLRHPSVVAVYGVVSGVVPPGHPVCKLGLRCSSGASNVT